MPIGDDFAIDYTNKRVYHSTGTTVYDVNDLYSWLMDTFDELAQMDDPVPMSAQTPTEYTMINGWFLDEGDGSEAHKYFKNGAIKTDGYLNEIQFIKLDGVTVDAQASDIGKQVKDDAVEVGPLLGFVVDKYGANTALWWVRTGSGNAILDNSVMTITGSTADGSASADSIDGENLYANIYTLGTIASVPNPQVYIFQEGEAIAEWSDKTNWDRGHIDVLILVKEAGVEIDGAVVEVYVRQAGDLYDNFNIDLSAGGRNAVPVASAPDLDNVTAEYYLLVDAETAAFSTVGQILTGGTSEATAEMVSYTDWGTTGVLTIRGIKGTFQDGETIAGSSEGSATVNGTVGDTYVTYDAEAVALTVGNICTGGTSTAKRILRGLQDDGTTGKLVLQINTTVTGNNRDPYYRDFQDLETLTDEGTGSVTLDADSITLVSGWDDITVAFVNGTVTYTTHGATEGINGERVTFTGGEGILLLDDTPSTATGTITLGNMTLTAITGLVITGDISGAVWTASQNLQSSHTMNKAFEQGTNEPYDIIIECGNIYVTGRTLAQVYEYFKFITEEDSIFKMFTVVSAVITQLDGEEYIKAYTGYTPKKAAPLGTFAGGKFFGPQGLWVEGQPSGQSYQLIDSDGDVNDPPVKATMKVTAVVSGDRILTCLKHATDMAPKEDQYNSHDTNNVQDDLDFVIEESIATDTPSSGTLRVLDASTGDGHRYRYASWASSTFTFVTGADGTATSADSAGTQLTDTAADFGGADDVEVGDIIVNTTDNSWGIVTEIVSTTVLKHTKLQGGTENDWDITDAYKTNVCAITYADGDTAYVPLLDLQADATSEEVEVIYSADRVLLIRVRKKGILPFQTSGTFTDAGLTVAAIRTADAIVT